MRSRQHYHRFGSNRIGLGDVVSRGMDDGPMPKDHPDIECFGECLMKGFRGLQQLQALVDERGRTRKVRFPIAGSLCRCYHIVKEIRYATAVKQWMNGIYLMHRVQLINIQIDECKKGKIERRAQRRYERSARHRPGCWPGNSHRYRCSDIMTKS